LNGHDKEKFTKALGMIDLKDSNSIKKLSDYLIELNYAGDLSSE
jgi:hypothetical protein